MVVLCCARLVVGFILSGIAASASAATITVRSSANSGGTCPGADCTLRKAISVAVAGDTIVFDMATVSSPITLTTSDLFVSKGLSIQGPGRNVLTIRATSSQRVFSVNLSSNPTVAISGLTITSDYTFSSNFSQTGVVDAYGSGTLNLSDSTISRGANLVGYEVSDYGTIAVNITGCTLLGSAASGRAIDRYSTGTMTVTNSTISGNTINDPGGIEGGAGLFNRNGAVVITNSTLSNNSSNASDGGAIYNTATLSLTNSTVSGNSVAGCCGIGGAVFNTGTLTISNSTLTANSASGNSAGRGVGGGIYNAGAVSLASSIVANNTATGGPNDISGAITSQGYNLIGRGDGGTGYTNGVNSDQVGTNAAPLDPRLAALGNNGGPTQTHALLGNSPAIDKGNSFGFTTDQRGLTRPFDDPAKPNAPGGDGSDIGAFEVQNSACTVSCPGNITHNTDPNQCGAVVNYSPPTGSCSMVTCAPASGSFFPAGSTAVTCSDQTGPTCSFTITVVDNNAPRVVTNNTDSGAGSLRQAIVDICYGGKITFDSSVTSPIVLASELAINKDTNIQGPGAHLLSISGNNAVRIFNVSSNSSLTLSGLTLTQSGQAILNAGTLNLIDSTLSDNYTQANGGAIANTGTANITNSTFFNNSAQFGGAILSGDYNSPGVGALNLVNCTFSDNGAFGYPSANISGEGGAIECAGGATNVTSCTLAYNSAADGGGMKGAGTVNVKNTIIARNGVNPRAQPPSVPTWSDVSGPFISQGYNLIGASDGSAGFTNGTNNDQIGTKAAPIDPTLGALAYNGGPTRTLSLLSGSPAIDKGNSFGLTTDQRRYPRPFDNLSIAPASGGDNSDIGAFELQPPFLRIVSLKRVSGGMRIDGNGIPSAIHRIEASSQPTSGFQQIGTSMSDVAGIFQFTDSTNLPRRFYHVVYP